MLHCNYTLLCFNDLTGDVCIGMLTERLWMIHIRQHADVFLQTEIASTVTAVFSIDRVLIDFSFADNCLIATICSKPRTSSTANRLYFQPIRGNIGYVHFPTLDAYLSIVLLIYLTNKEALAVYYTVIKHDGHLRTRGKCRKKHEPQASVFYISRVFSNIRSVLSQCNTRIRLLHLLYDIDFTRAKQ